MLLSTLLALSDGGIRTILAVVLPVFLLVWAVAMGRVLLKPLQKHEILLILLVKWACSACLAWCMVRVAIPALERGGLGAAFTGFPVALFTILGFVVVWRRSIAEMIARPFENLYLGGNQAYEARPIYSMGQARRKQGRFAEAIDAVQEQLERFPDDLEGHLLIAEIQARNLKDLAAAEQTINGYCAGRGRSPKQLTSALYALADWHREIGQDREAAARCFERVVELLPDTEFAANAANRIAHLGGSEMYLPAEGQRKFNVVEGPKSMGLASTPPPRPPETDPAQVAAGYVQHLQCYPLDLEVREKLAVLYADHFDRLDLAAEQLEQLITLPHAPTKLAAHWLNLLADLQLRHGADFETVSGTLQRIIDRYPKTSIGEIARKRLNLLRLEFKGVETRPKVQMGVYEQKIGLKKGMVNPYSRARGREPGE